MTNDAVNDRLKIDFIQLLSALWANKYMILGLTILAAGLSVIYALSLPNIYRSEALLSPVAENTESIGGGVLSQFSNLASLGGLNFNNDDARSVINSLATLRSRIFIGEFIDKYNLKVQLMASIPGEEDGTVRINPEIYDSENQMWVRSVSPPRSVIPSNEEVYDVFSEILFIEQDEESGLITVAIEWYDPVQIKNWLDWMINDLNERMKYQDLEEAQKSLNYLQDQLNKTQLVEMRNVFYNLIETETQKIMLADVRDEYIFSVIDPPVVPEIKERPYRAVICVLGTFLGGLIASFLALFKEHAYPSLKRMVFARSNSI